MLHLLSLHNNLCQFEYGMTDDCFPLIIQYRTDEVERKPLHSGIGDHLEQLQPTSQGTDSNKRKGRNGKGRRGKGHKGKGRKGKGHKHRKAVDLQVVPHKAQSQENAYLNDHLSARDDSAEKFERSLDDIE